MNLVIIFVVQWFEEIVINLYKRPSVNVQACCNLTVLLMHNEGLFKAILFTSTLCIQQGKYFFIQCV